MPLSVNRREFLRRAALTAGTIGAAGLVTGTSGCNDGPSEPRELPAPTGVTVQAISATRIQVKWTDASTEETGFEIDRKLATESTFTPLASLPPDTTEYNDDSVTERTMYDYRVRAVSGERVSEFSPIVSTETPAAEVQVPADVSAVALSGSRIQVRWVDTSSVETGFEIQRRAAVEPDFSPLVSLPPNTTEYNDDAVAERTMYEYKVRAVSEDKVSDFSPAVSAQTPAANAPAAPASLVVDQITLTSVHLTWQDQATTENGYRIVRNTNGVITEVGTVADATEFTATGLPTGQRHVFTVIAFNEAGDSAPSNAVSVRTGSVADNFAVKVMQPGKILLTWADLTAGGASVRLERKQGDQDFQILATLPGPATSFTDTSVPAGARLEYRFSGVDEISIPSGVTIDTPSSPPNVPASLTAVPSPDNGSRIRLGWDMTALAARSDLVLSDGGFDIQRRTEQTSFVSLASLDDTAVRSYDDLATNGKIFAQLSYRVRAWNLAGYSDFTETVSAIPRHVIVRSTVSAVETIGKSALVTVPVPAIFFSSFSCGTSTRLQVYLIRLSAEEVVAIGANCTHACCVINYNENVSDPAAGGFTCPCHGSQYRMDGSVKRGPAGNPVAVFQVVTFDDRFELIADHTIPQA